jgi:hypothetical protein
VEITTNLKGFSIAVVCAEKPHVVTNDGTGRISIAQGDRTEMLNFTATVDESTCHTVMDSDEFKTVHDTIKEDLRLGNETLRAAGTFFAPIVEKFSDAIIEMIHVNIATKSIQNQEREAALNK